MEGMSAIDKVNPLEILYVGGFGSAAYVYFTGNVNGAGLPQNIQGLSFGWNRSGGGGESLITYNTSLGSYPRLTFNSFNGSTFIEEMVLTQGRLGVGTQVPQARAHIHEPSELGPVKGDHVILFSVSGKAANHFANYHWLLRDSDNPPGQNQWWYARLHDGISIDYTFVTPGVNTRVWWERDPMDNIQSWGNADQTFMTLKNGALGLGTTEPGALLTVKGDIHTREVRVDMNGSVAGDYVFQSDYNLLSLHNLESYINANSHLPEVPSASEMEADGINLKEMNLILLKKVEELTLHIIEINRKVESLQKENTIQEHELEKIRNKNRFEGR